jgi:dihydropteroate synthase
MRLRLREQSLELSRGPLIMGILNITPDSFSDGGLYLEPSRALEHAYRMLQEGADIIDVGGESTRPGAEPVPPEEELRRVIPVIRTLARNLPVPISIDTYKASVAERALAEGAQIVNDISGLRFDPRMASVAARHKAAVVIMHIKGTPRDMQKEPSYQDLMKEIKDYLAQGIRLALQAGLAEEAIAVDPGIGFGKRPEHNLQILKHLQELKELGRPILVGASRKSFIAHVLEGLPPQERLEGTLAAQAIAVLKGAHILRVHDVKASKRAALLAWAIREA